MADYFVELSQIGSSGRVSFTTNFGFGFTTVLIEQTPELKIPSRSKNANEKAISRDRVIRLISSCHQAVLSLIPEHEFVNGTMVIKSSNYYCYVCGVRSEYPHEFIDREYLEFTDQLFRDFMSCIVLAGVYELDAVLIAEKLFHISESIWDRTQNGERIRKILHDYRGVIEL